MKLFIVGLLLFFTTSSVFGWYKNDKTSKISYPLELGPEKLPPPPTPQSFGKDYVREAELQAGELKDWYLQETKQFYDHKPGNKLPHTPNNFNFYIVQNFFLGKPYRSPSSANGAPSPGTIVKTCRKNKDCKEPFHHCVKGVCELQPQYQKPQHCKIDHDCHLYLPKGAIANFRVLCDKGHCKFWQRKPNTPEVQMCLYSSDCINRGVCRKNLCIARESANNAPLPPHLQPSQGRCKVDRDCTSHFINGVLLPVYCDNGQCKRGRRPTEIPPTSENQFCNFDLQCNNGGKCRNNRCVPRETSIASSSTSNDGCHDEICPTPSLSFPHTHSRLCKIDRDCEYELPGGIMLPIPFLPMHCNKGLCKHGRRKPKDPQSPVETEYQFCKLASECFNHGECRNNRCVPRQDSSTFPIGPLHPYPRNCKIDRDCEYELPGGLMLPIPFLPMHCNKGLCKHGRREPKDPQSPVETEYQLCKLASECFNRGECRNNRCVPRQDSSTFPIGPLHPYPRNCKIDRDCEYELPGGIMLPIPFLPMHCNKGLCKHGRREPKDPQSSASEGTTKTPSQPLDPFHHPCHVDHDCRIKVPRGMHLSIPVHCNKGKCEFGIRRHNVSEVTKPTDVSAPTTIPSTNDVTVKTPAPPSKPKKCKTNDDCIKYLEPLSFPEWTPQSHCLNGECSILLSKNDCTKASDCKPGKICMHNQCRSFGGRGPVIISTTKKPSECKINSDCYQPDVVCGGAQYCDNGRCLSPRFSVSMDILIPATKKPCTDDSACFAHSIICGIPHRCENSKCVSASQSSTQIATNQQDSTLFPSTLSPSKTTKKQRLCQRDSDCSRRGLYRPKILQYCNNGVCTLGRRPTLPSTSTTTQQSPITKITTFETLAPLPLPKQCKQDVDCLQQIGFQHKSLVNVFCHNGHCALNKSPTTTTESPTTTDDKSVTRDLRRCNTHNDCAPFTTIATVAFCYNHHCYIGDEPIPTIRPSKISTTTTKKASTPSRDTPNVESPEIIVTVRPLENLPSTKQPTDTTKKCKRDSDCLEISFRHRLVSLQCLNGECLYVVPKPGPTAASTSTSKNPKKHTITSQHLTSTSKTTKKVPLESVTVRATPHVYSCRRNRDCKDFPRPKNMPVYCEHRICKHGNRRPKNDFDSCKVDGDCSIGEGPCINNFCARPRLLKKAVKN